MSFIISRGYAEVQILKTSESDPLIFLEHFDMHLSKFWKKSKTEKDIKHFHMFKHFHMSKKKKKKKKKMCRHT